MKIAMSKNAAMTIAVSVVALLSSVLNGQIFDVNLSLITSVEVQEGGPLYDYHVGVHEVTNAQFVAFLNDAQFHNEAENPGFGNERGDNMEFQAVLPDPGDVGLVDKMMSNERDAIFDVSRSLIEYNPGEPVGQRYSVPSDKADHPAVGMGWFGAVKFCNWLTIDHSLGLDQRCYSEGGTAFDWFPLTVGNEIGGTQEDTNAVRDLNVDERAALVHGFRGFRLLMDQGGPGVGAVNAVPRRFNEWYKAAAFDPAAPDFPRTVFEGFLFEEHTVPPFHWVHGFGRDELTESDANYRDSGDPFDDPSPSVIATTPAMYYDGTDHGGIFQTTQDANHYGLFDVSGSVWEFLTDQVTITDSSTPDRSIVGGSYRSNTRQVTPANRGDIGPGSTRPVVGFRVMRVINDPCVPGDWNLDGAINVKDFRQFDECRNGPAINPDRGCGCFDSDDDGDIDFADFAEFQRLIGSRN